MKEQLRKYALKNAFTHGEAKPKAVVNKVLGKNPELRKKAKEVFKTSKNVIEEVNQMSQKEMEKEIQENWPEMLEETEEEEKRLKDLEDAENGRFRFAPNPNGPPTLGSARGVVINKEYSERYNGEFICRFDDTDPVTKRPMLEAYDWYLEDMEWLDCKPDEVYYASERIELYYNYAEQAIEEGHAYVCKCSQEKFSNLKNNGKKCPHRDQSIEKNMDEWNKMLEGDYEEKEAVLRLKTDLDHKDPALRDWVCFRILKKDHPRVGEKHVVWPMLDFQGAIDDHVLEVTHIIRGKDLRDSTRRQKFLYDYFDWEYPKTYYWGRVSVFEFGRLSTSEIKRGIDKGEFSGWDDPQLPTIRAYRKRGFKPEAIKQFWLDFGLTRKDIQASLTNLYSYNKKELEEESNRYFFVKNPIAVVAEECPEKEVKIPLHPDFKERGNRDYLIEEGVHRFYISGNDAKELVEGDEVRLKNYMNIEIVEKGKNEILAKHAGNDLINPKLQWVPEKRVNVDVLRPEGRVDQGFAEEYLLDVDEGEVVQFERYGFVKVDEKDDDEVICYFTND